MAYKGFKKKSTDKLGTDTGAEIEDIPLPLASKDDKKYKFQEGKKKDDNSMVFALIGALLFFIIVIIGALIFFFLGNAQPPVISGNFSNITANITNATLIQCDDACLLALALSSSTIAPCRDMANASSKSECFTKLSNISQEACFELANGSTFVSCVNHHATSSNDASVCLHLSGTDAVSCMAAVDPCYAKNGTEQKNCSHA